MEKYTKDVATLQNTSTKNNRLAVSTRFSQRTTFLNIIRNTLAMMLDIQKNKFQLFYFYFKETRFLLRLKEWSILHAMHRRLAPGCCALHKLENAGHSVALEKWVPRKFVAERLPWWYKDPAAWKLCYSNRVHVHLEDILELKRKSISEHKNGAICYILL